MMVPPSLETVFLFTADTAVNFLVDDFIMGLEQIFYEHNVAEKRIPQKLHKQSQGLLGED